METEGRSCVFVVGQDEKEQLDRRPCFPIGGMLNSKHLGADKLGGDIPGGDDRLPAKLCVCLSTDLEMSS